MQAIQEGFQVTVEGEKMETTQILTQVHIQSYNWKETTELHRKAHSSSLSRIRQGKDVCVKKFGASDVYLHWTGNQQTIHATDYLHGLKQINIMRSAWFNSEDF